MDSMVEDDILTYSALRIDGYRYQEQKVTTELVSFVGAGQPDAAIRRLRLLVEHGIVQSQVSYCLVDTVCQGCFDNHGLPPLGNTPTADTSLYHLHLRRHNARGFVGHRLFSF